MGSHWLRGLCLNMLVQHVFLEFNNLVGHIRAKAAWVAGQYAHIIFSDPNNFVAWFTIQQPHPHVICTAKLQLMQGCLCQQLCVLNLQIMKLSVSLLMTLVSLVFTSSCIRTRNRIARLKQRGLISC